MKVYNKDKNYSYTLGVFPTIELLKNKPQVCTKVIISQDSVKNSGLPVIQELCRQHHIPIEIDDKTINKLSKKGNCYAIGIFDKYECKIENKNHVVLVNPSDMGNMGTMLRTMLGFGYFDLIIIRPGVDIFDPKVIRASMGSIFQINFKYYDSFEEYQQEFNDRDIYTLMLQGATNIHSLALPTNTYSVVFGNESSGLPEIYQEYGTSVFIPHTGLIDSLNLSMAVGITLMWFSQEQFKDIQALSFEKAS